MGLKLFKRHDPYDDEEGRLRTYLSTLDVSSDEYAEAQARLLMNSTIREKNHESKRSLDKTGRANVIVKIVGGLGTLLGIGALGYYECSGNTFSGEKRKLADGLSELVINLFKAGRRG